MMKNTISVLCCLNVMFALQAMDCCNHKQSDNASMQEVAVRTTQSDNSNDNPTFTQAVAQGALTGVMKYTCGVHDDPTSSKEAALKGAVHGAAHGLRRAYMILRHLQS